jgi:hypothetical protein
MVSGVNDEGEAVVGRAARRISRSGQARARALTCGPFLTRACLHPNAGAFGQVRQPCLLQHRAVEEELLVSVIGCDKAKAFGGVEPLHCPKAPLPCTPLPCRRGSDSLWGCRPGVQLLLLIRQEAVQLLRQEQGLV